MEFKDILAEYIKQLGCSAKELCENSGLSAATISRYRSGERVPEAGTENLVNLMKGIVRIAENRRIADITEQSVSKAFSPFVKGRVSEVTKLQTNFNTLLTLLSVNVAELSRFLNYDPSYVSRIRNGLRQTASPKEFAWGTAQFIARRYQNDSQKALIADLIGCEPASLADYEAYQTLLFEWLMNGSDIPKNDLSDFLEKLDKFNLNEYIRAIHFDEMKVPSAPFQLPTSKSYQGLKEMMDSELAFLKATVLSKSMEPVIMYSDMPMEEMAKDEEFPKKWMFGMTMMLKKGLHLNQIHNINRSFGDMMLGLESWIPLYMTGQISPYYLTGTNDSVFLHFLKVSGSVALAGEAINGYHSKGKYYLTKNKDEVAYYKKRAECLLSKASLLMEIYRQDRERDYRTFLQADAKTEGNRHSVLSSLPLYTATDELIRRVLQKNQIPDAEQAEILQYVSTQREISDEILRHGSMTEEIPIFTEAEFQQYPMTLPLSGIFLEKDVFYSWEDYREHLNQIQEYKKEHPNYTIVDTMVSPFRNIQIYIHEGEWVIVSKNKAPAIHFLIRHPKMRSAFENMIVPIIDN